jgi:glycosyltransferase involved in cell wall biosynthesis
MSSGTSRQPLPEGDAAEARPHVSIVVPCRDEIGHIEASLESMLAQEGFNGGFEVIVADGGSRDGTRQFLDMKAASTSRVRVVDNPGRVVSTGLNIAVREARGDVIVRMDVHAEYASDYVAKCLEALASTGADCVGGPARTRTRTFFQRANALAYHSPFSVGGARFHDPAYEGWVDTVTYGCWRRSTLERLGGFDEELVRNQDDELALRLTRAGGSIWQSPSIRSWYYPRASLSALFRQYVQYGYWKVRAVQKHRLPASVRHLVPGAFVAALILLAVLSPFWRSARLLLAGSALLYALATATAAVAACRGAGNRRYIPLMPFVFGAYHLGYGWGFLRGVVDFVLLGRAPRAAFARPTR